MGQETWEPSFIPPLLHCGLRQGQLLGLKDCLLDENMKFALLNMFSHT